MFKRLLITYWVRKWSPLHEQSRICTQCGEIRQGLLWFTCVEPTLAEIPIFLKLVRRSEVIKQRPPLLSRGYRYDHTFQLPWLRLA